LAGQQSQLLLATVAVIALAMVGWGIWSIRRENRTFGILCLTVGAVSIISAGFLSAAEAGVSAWAALLAVELVCAVFLTYIPAHSQLSPWRLIVLLSLRCLSALVLLAMLFKPAICVLPSWRGGLPTLPVLLDRSGSMTTGDCPGWQNRFRQAVLAVDAQEGRLSKGFLVSLYPFSGGLASACSLGGLDTLSTSVDTTEGTDIAGAIRGALSDQAGRTIEAMLVISDGIHNDGDSPVASASQAEVPIYTVGVGSDRSSAQDTLNAAILSADCPLQVTADDIATIGCRVQTTGLDGTSLQVRLIDVDSSRTIDSADLWADASAQTRQVELKWTPTRSTDQTDAADIRRLRLQTDSVKGERIILDNAFDLHALVTDRKIRVLYVEGALRPEFKFLRRYLSGDGNIQFVSLVRVSEDRFLAQGDIDGKRLESLPQGEEIGLFDVIILGDLDSTLLTREQISLLRRFVNDGGGLAMLGGHNSFGPGGYGDSEIDQLMPVVSGGRDQNQETARFVPQLTSAGEAHPIFAGIAGHFAGPDGRPADGDKARLPNLLGCVEVVRAKPAAEVLAVHPSRENASGPLIVLAVQRFGAGRAAAVTCDTTWRWYLPLRVLGRDNPYERFWGQLIRWLADEPARARDGAACVVAQIDKQYIRLGQSVRLTAKVLDDSGSAPHRATAWAELRPADGTDETQRFELARRPGDDLFHAELTPAGQGRFVIAVEAEDESSQPLGAEELPLAVASPSTEFEQLARNDDLLRRIAEVSGGEFADISQLPELVDRIIQRRMETVGPPPERVIRRLYHFPTFLLALVCLLTAEWLLRRHWRLS